MENHNDTNRGMRLLAAGAIALVLAGCASIGRPSGGAYDYDPPVFLGATPRVGATGVKSSRITLEFNENVQVQDAMNKVVVSPAQKSFPQVTANGRKLTVDIRDTIIPNTTYTIDFSDAVRDLNEGNVLDGLAIDFSTGDAIDSLRISGMVFEARTLEPAQGIIVGVYSNLADSAISILQMERIAKTNQYGQFTIRGLKPQPYRLFAVNDINRDYHWDRSEDVAFYDTVVTPWCETVELTDTLLSSQGTDSLVSRTATVYKPNDLLLTWFNEGYTPQYLKDYSRPSRRRMLVKFSAKSDTLPTLRVVGGKMDGRVIDHTLATLNANVGNDSLEYFLRDSTLIASDTLMIAMTSLRTDTADRLVWGTDTLRFNFKAPKAPKKKKKKKDDEEEDSVPQLDFLNFSFKGSGKQSIYDVMRFSVDQPVDTFLPEGIHFEMLRDTIWDTIPSPVFTTDTLGILSYKASAQWQPSTKYRLTIDSASIIGIYNEWNRPFSAEFTTTAPEEYSALYFDVSGITDSAYIELLDRSDKVVAQAPLRGGVAEFPHIDPGEYYARLWADRNGNGLYDTGNLLSATQPEDVYYYPKKISLKRNWDVEQVWNVFDTPVDLQKPAEIKKNKPKVNKVRRRNPDGSYIDDDTTDGRPDEEEDPWSQGSDNFFGPGRANGQTNIGTQGTFNNNMRNLRR